MSTVVFSHPKQELPEGGNLSGRAELFAKLNDLDVTPRVSLGAEQAFDVSGVEAYAVKSETETIPVGRIAIGDVDVLVNRIGRSYKYDVLPRTWTSEMPPVLNENAMRSLAFRKHLVQDEVLAPLGLGIPTMLAQDTAGIERFLEANPATQYIAKPSGGTDGIGVFRLDADKVLAHFNDAPELLDKTVVQPAYNLTLPLPEGFRAYDAACKEAFDGWTGASVPKELRFYGFHSPAETQIFPVGRAIENGTDHWFFIDPASVPEKLMTDAQSVLQKAAEVSGSLAVFAALDIAYGQLATEDPAFHVVELNGKAPYMIGYDLHTGVADTLRDMHALQIRQTIDAKA